MGWCNTTVLELIVGELGGGARSDEGEGPRLPPPLQQQLLVVELAAEDLKALGEAVQPRRRPARRAGRTDGQFAAAVATSACFLKI